MNYRMEKNNHNMSLLKDVIEQVKNDNELLEIITNLIDELENLDPIWNDTINKLLNLNITKKFKNKIKTFFKNNKNVNTLLIFNVLLETYDVIEDFESEIQENVFYVILKELTFILNEKSIGFQTNYTKALKYLKNMKLTLLK